MTDGGSIDEALEGTSGAEESLRWWSAQPETWAHVRCDPVPPEEGMERCLSWLDSFGSDVELAARFI